LNSVATTSTTLNFASYMTGSFVNGLSDMLRVGQGTGNALYNAQNGWDVAIGITEDVGRAAGLASMVGGGMLRTTSRIAGAEAEPIRVPQPTEAPLLGRPALGEGPGPMTRLIYEDNPKHTSFQQGPVAPAPINGQAALDGAVGFSENSTAKIGLDADGTPVV